ncbi:MAG: methyltransferase domain-containing protein [Lysobacteraceae bacterium]
MPTSDASTQHSANPVDAEAPLLARTWFYPYRLPSGRIVPTCDGEEIVAIHHTRLQMLDAALANAFPAGVAALTAVDLACHQGWFAAHLAQQGFSDVLGVDARAQHIADASLIRDSLALPALQYQHADVHALDVGAIGARDLVLCFGLIYHLENPVGALRTARALCKRVCLIETQVAPGLSGWIDYGNHQYVRPLQGSFAVIDETEETHGPEASTTGICLVPSTDALLWILHKVGFARTEILPVPEGGYEQLLHHKRVMVAAWVD